MWQRLELGSDDVILMRLDLLSARLEADPTAKCLDARPAGDWPLLPSGEVERLKALIDRFGSFSSVSSSDVYDESASEEEDSVRLRADITVGCLSCETDADLRVLAMTRARERSNTANAGRWVGREIGGGSVGQEQIHKATLWNFTGDSPSPATTPLSKAPSSVPLLRR